MNNQQNNNIYESTDLRSNFINWYFNAFHAQSLYELMGTISEDSIWHRERTVAVHTDMVVAEYISRTQQWGIHELLGALACAFHDVGKPACRQEKYKPERGTYWAYSGHELLSARLWENYAVKYWNQLKNYFPLESQDIYRVGWAIEHHRPWGLIKHDKLQTLANTIDFTVGRNVYINILMADNWGRIGDNQSENQMQSLNWINNFTQNYVANMINVDDSSPVLIMPIAASGSGKSTYFTKASDADNYNIYSLDLLRLQWYGEPYAEAFAKACADKSFNGNAQREYRNMLKKRTDIFIDNTNTSRKRRAFYLTEAKRAGYQTVALLLPVDVDSIIERQQTRADKCVPTEAVIRQYNGLMYPSIGEFDSIIVSPTNLPTE